MKTTTTRLACAILLSLLLFVGVAHAGSGAEQTDFALGCQPFYIEAEEVGFWGRLIDWRAWSNRGFFGRCNWLIGSFWW